MTEVRIRNVNDWVVDSLRLRARAMGQSLEGALRELLSQEAMRPKLKLAHELRQMREKLRAKYGSFLGLRHLDPRRSGCPRMIVLDANVAAKTYLEEAGAEAATELLAGPTKLLAPELIRMEVAGALCRRVRKGELESDEAEIRCQHWLAELDKGLFTLTADRDLLPEAIALSTKLKHALPDCLRISRSPFGSTHL